MAATKTATLAELEERIAAGEKVSPAELAEAEAAVRLAEKVEAARLAREADQAEAARLAAVEALRRRFTAEVAGSAQAVLDARRAVFDALGGLWRAAEEHNRLVEVVAAEVGSLAAAGPTPGIHAERGLSRGWVVIVGGSPHPKRGMIGGVRATSVVDGALLAAEAVEDAARARGENDDVEVFGRRAVDQTARRAPVDSPARRALESLACLVEGLGS